MSNDWYQIEPAQTPEQTRIRKGLGITNLLDQRTCWSLGDRIHVEVYEHSQDAPNLIFLPGIGTYSELYAELLVELKAQGFNVFAVDPPGHGYSAGERGYYKIEPFCAQLSDLLDQLTRRYTGSWHLYGYSIGALISVAFAERDSRVRQVFCGTLLLTEFPPDYLHWLGWNFTSINAFFFPTLRVPLKSFIDFEQLLGSHPAGPLINSDPRIVFDYPFSTLDNLFSQRSGIVTDPFGFDLLIVQGTEDEVLSIEYARDVITKLAHPARLIEVPGAGHMLPWDDPKGLAEILSKNRV